jgi:hypothetical protein
VCLQIKESLEKQAGKKTQASKQAALQSKPERAKKGCKMEDVRAESIPHEQGDDAASQGKAKRKRGKKEMVAGAKRQGKPGKRQREAMKAAAATAAAAGTSGGGSAET